MSLFKSEITKYIQTPFPLNTILFDRFISYKQYGLGAKTKEKEKIITDGEAIFLIVISTLQKSGVQFSSPGNSQKRNFIYWFNSHFNINEPFSHPINIKEKYFEIAYDIVLNLSKEALFFKTTKSKLNNFDQQAIEDIGNLTIKGKQFLTSLFHQI